MTALDRAKRANFANPLTLLTALTILIQGACLGALLILFGCVRKSATFIAAPPTSVVDSKGVFGPTSHAENDKEKEPWEVARLSSVCRVVDGAQRVSVERPLEMARGAGGYSGGRPTFPFSVEYVAPASPAMPVVVRIPGGPGDSFWGDVPLLPEGWGYINTEPRGIGCNRPLDLERNEPFFGSRLFAGDLEAILRRLELPHVILHGQGYGSVVATLLAAQTESWGTTSAVVFEGALAVPFPSSAPAGAALVQRWEAAKARFPKSSRAFVLSEANPLGIDDDAWGAEIFERLTQGTFFDPASGTLRTPLVELLGEADSVRTGLLNFQKTPRLRAMQAQKKPWTQEKKALFREVACRELSSLSSFGPPRFQSGKFVSPKDPNGFDSRDVACEGVAFSRPLSLASLRWRGEVPVFWLENEAECERLSGEEASPWKKSSKSSAAE
ncbi:MAG: alpha/beta fold hydrolase [Silvanigrellales bacterium]|nr:alpha/beta fold hydrolase [Silvanigrellales bacterium]